MSWIKIPSTKNNCPGIREFIRPIVRYVKCHSCGGDVEVWSDENQGICIDCGTKWIKPDDQASCLDYCKYAEQCKKIITAQKTLRG